MSRSAASPLPLILALFVLYIVWGSTYFAIRLGVESWPPLMMAGLRFLLAGLILFAVLIWRGQPLPGRRAVINACLIGILLLAIGNGLVTLAEHQQVPSGLAAVMVATVPLFAMCFSRLFGIRTRKIEWLGILVGLCGIVLLNSGGHLAGNPLGAVLVLIAALSWAFGSVLGSRITLPQGAMAGAVEMLVAGVVLLLASLFSGERLTAIPDLQGFLALGYLMLFGSIIAINAYMYLIRNVTPAVATSYAYVNPVVAVLLGTSFGGESLSPIEWLALAIIIFAVVLVTLGKTLFPAREENVSIEADAPKRKYFAPPANGREAVSGGWQRKRMDALMIDRRVAVAGKDPLLKTRDNRFIIQLKFSAQRALPNHQHLPLLLCELLDMAAVTLYVAADFSHPERGAGRRYFKQVAVMVMPETAMHENNRPLLVQHKVGPARQIFILYPKVKTAIRQQVAQSLFNGSITRANCAHILATHSGRMHISHIFSPCDLLTV